MKGGYFGRISWGDTLGEQSLDVIVNNIRCCFAYYFSLGILVEDY